MTLQAFRYIHLDTWIYCIKILIPTVYCTSSLNIMLHKKQLHGKVHWHKKYCR